MGNLPQSKSTTTNHRHSAQRHPATSASSRVWGDDARHGILLSPGVLDDLSEEIAMKVTKRLAMQPALVDRYQLSELINVSVPTVERLQRDGRIPVVRIGRRVLYNLNSVLAALSESTVEPFSAVDPDSEPGLHDRHTSIETPSTDNRLSPSLATSSKGNN